MIPLIRVINDDTLDIITSMRRFRIPSPGDMMVIDGAVWSVVFRVWVWRPYRVYLYVREIPRCGVLIPKADAKSE